MPKKILIILISSLTILFLLGLKFRVGPDTRFDYEVFFDEHPNFHSDGFQMPLNPPNAEGYYNAQFFGVNLHLGEDWNGVGGGNTDLGDPVYVVSNGYVSEAKNFGGGWGNIVTVVHKIKLNDSLDYIESLYAHLDEIHVSKGDSLRIGQQIGTIGNADGAYWAHLHLELRKQPEMPIGGGYGENVRGHLVPTDFIKSNPVKTP